MKTTNRHPSGQPLMFSNEEAPLAWGLPAEFSEWQRHYRSWLDNPRPRRTKENPREPSVECSLWQLAMLYHLGSSAPPNDRIANGQPRSGNIATDDTKGIDELISGSSSDWPASCEWPAWQSWLDQIERPFVRSIYQAPTDDHRESDANGTDAALQRMAHWIQRSHDNDGWPHAALVQEWPMILAGIARCARLLRKHKLPVDESFQVLMESIPEKAVRLLRPDGTLMFGPPGANLLDASFRKRLVRMADDRDIARLFKRCLPPSTSKRKPGRESVGFPEPADRTEWGGVAVMQDAWHWGAPKLGMTYDGGTSLLEISNQVTLCRGPFLPQIKVDRRKVELETDFAEICWHSDEEIDYLELEADLSDGSRLQRQLLLVRGDETAVWMDTVLADEPRDLELSIELPIDPDIELQPETETTEHYFRSRSDGRYQALVVPLSMSEWKTDLRQNRFEYAGDSLAIKQVARKSRAMTVAVAFDLSPSRSVRPRTWRQLTVAEHLQPVPSDVAVAFRWQFEFQQWLVYRVQGRKGNRTFMGVNVTEDFYCGRFYSNGRAEHLLQIEE